MVSPRDATKMCPHKAQFTIFWVLTLLLLLAVCCVRCVGKCSVCGVLLVCVVVCVVVACRTHSQDHGVQIHFDVNVGVTLFAHFS